MIRFIRWDICGHFHGLNDFGHGESPGTYSRSRTYTAECYEQQDAGEKARCRRRGKCVVAVLAAEAKAKEVDQ